MSFSWNVQHTWSLAYEEQFYIIAPLVLSIVTPRKKHLLAIALCGWHYCSSFFFALHEGAVAGFMDNSSFSFVVL